jgi:hypothetical protein
MKRLLPLFVLALIAAPVGAEEGWVQLFNGKDLTGWKIHPKANGAFTEIITVKDGDRVTGYDGKLKDGSTVHLWRVEDRILIGSGPSSHLFSERDDYTDFEYRVEAMINDHGNSGQYFRTKFAGGFPPGYEAQINATHGDPIRTGSLYPDGRTKLKDHKKEITVMNTAPHKADEWFTQEVTMKGSHITIKVNGKVTVDWTDPDNNFTKGHFALQGHDPGTVVKFRKVEVKELK